MEAQKGRSAFLNELSQDSMPEKDRLFFGSLPAHSVDFAWECSYISDRVQVAICSFFRH